MQIRTASLADAASLIELWTAAGLRFRPEHVPADLEAVLARDPNWSWWVKTLAAWLLRCWAPSTAAAAG
jgi:hypothetical protein